MGLSKEEIERLKKTYAHEQTTDKQGNNKLVFDVMELKLPKDFKGQWVHVRYDKNKNPHIVYIHHVGLDPKVKEERRQKRQEKARLRKDLRTEIQELHKKLNISLANNEDGEAELQQIREKVLQLEEI
jgi:hypothetical protein